MARFDFNVVLDWSAIIGGRRPGFPFAQSVGQIYVAVLLVRGGSAVRSHRAFFDKRFLLLLETAPHDEG